MGITVDPTIAYGVTASFVVVLALQVFKSLGLPDNLWPWATLIMSIVLVVGGALVGVFPIAQQVLNAIVAVLSVYAIATGLYHTGKNIATHTGLSTGNFNHTRSNDVGSGDGPGA